MEFFTPLPIDEDRNSTMDQHLSGLTAEQYGRHPMSTVGSHSDQITAVILGGIDDRLVGMLMFDMQDLACDALL